VTNVKEIEDPARSDSPLPPIAIKAALRV